MVDTKAALRWGPMGQRSAHLGRLDPHVKRFFVTFFDAEKSRYFKHFQKVNNKLTELVLEQAELLEEIRRASARIAPYAVTTPVLESPALNALTGGRVLMKCEVFQRTGSFKFRGAFNRLSLIPAAERARGVVAFSSGNHAQGVAHAAQLLGMAATIVMPADSPKLKVDNTRGFGAEVVLYDRWRESREAIGARIAAETGATLVKPFDDWGVIAGQGAVGLEFVAQAQALRVERLDAMLICCSGGGLAAGVSSAVKATYPMADIITVEPAAHDDMARSLASDQRLTNPPEAPPSICDALMSPFPGELTLPVLRRLGARGVGVTDAQAAQAVAYAFNTLKLVVEPGGAAALAAALSGLVPTAGRTIGLTLSGGNVDLDMFQRCVLDAF
jgi:threonine dehydratase